MFDESDKLWQGWSRKEKKELQIYSIRKENGTFAADVVYFTQLYAKECKYLHGKDKFSTKIQISRIYPRSERRKNT